MSNKSATPYSIKGTYGTMYYVSDVTKTTAFLKEKLGIKPHYEDPNWTEFHLNGHSLCIHPIEDKKEVYANGSLILHVDGIKEMVADLKAKGVKGISGPHEIYPGSFHAQFTDLDDNVISLYEGPKSST